MRAAARRLSSRPTAQDPVKGQEFKGKVRHLLLIRHGQYDLDSDDHGLTELGKKQSVVTGVVVSRRQGRARGAGGSGKGVSGAVTEAVTGGWARAGGCSTRITGAWGCARARR